MTKRLYVWDFTVPEKNNDQKLLKDMLKSISKKWVFQLEKGETGYHHFQGRLSLIKKTTVGQLAKLISSLNIVGCHLSPTSNNQAMDTENYLLNVKFTYVMKAETRIDGPWKDTDEEIYIPRQIREMGPLRPFQEHIIKDANNWDTRSINVVFCPHGNIGKSCLVGYCRAHKIGRALPTCNDYKDLLRMVCDLPTSKMYLFDMPRSLNKDKLYQFFSAVETIKDGYAYDDRYSFKEKVFDCPNIWIFTNTMPELTMLSDDRWKIWTVNDTYELVQN